METRLVPYRGWDVWQLLRLRQRTRGDMPALVWHPFDGEPATWTYSELTRDAAATAVGLAGRGVKSGDRVLLHLENSPEFVISWYACAALGATAVTTNTRSAPDELRYYADHCGAVAAVTQPGFAEMVANAASGVRFMVTTDDFRSLLGDPDDLVDRAPDPHWPMSVQYTSGTTSRPKGVLWTHANALWGAQMNAVHESLRPDDCHLVYMPLFHTNALAYSMLASLWVGARFVLIPKWSSSRFWDVSLQHGCTWLSLMGMSARVLATADVPPDHTYRLFGAGVCDMPWDERVGVKTVGWWGMTETISHGIVGDPYTPNRPGSMGRPAPEYGISVVGDDGVSPVEPEETGQLLVKGVRGLSLFSEYLGDPAATAASFDEGGWFRTGDLVTPHADGHLSFADRSKDMLKVGAENVAASEVERVILGVEGVVEAAVIGSPDPKLDEVPIAFVIGIGTADELADRVLAECANKLADFKVPRAVHVVRELPRSTLNKVNKAALRDVGESQAERDTAQQRWLDEARLDPSGNAG